MHYLAPFCIAAAAALAFAACKPAEPPPAAIATPAPVAPAAAVDPSVTASYECDGGHRVDIVGESTARITLSTGQTVTIPYVENSRPPSFMGRGLRFAIGDKAIMLIQSDGEGVACRPAASA